MNRCPTRGARRSQKGAALLVALFAVLVVSLVAVSSVGLMQQRIHDARRDTDQTIARNLADGGVERALSWFIQPANLTKTALPADLASYAVSEGRVSVTLDVPNGVITSSSTVGNVTATTRVLFSLTTVTVPPPYDWSGLLGCGIITDWNINGNGTAGLRGFTDVRVHSNNLLDIKNINTFAQKWASSTAALAYIFKVKSGPTPIKQKIARIEIPLLNWGAFEAEAKSKTFTYIDQSQGNKSITRSNFFATAADFVQVVNATGGATLNVTGPVYIKTGPLSCTNISISGGPLIVEGDLNIRVTGNGYVRITNCAAWPVAIAWKGGELYFGGNSISTIGNTIYSETGGNMDFQGTAFSLNGAIMLRGKPASGAASLALNGTPDMSLVKMSETALKPYFTPPGVATTTTTLTLLAWR